MNKLFKSVLALILVVAISCFGIVNVNAKSLKITKKTYIKTGIGSRKEAKFYTSKGYAYCITPMKTGANQGTTLYYKNTIHNGGLVWLIENGGHSDKAYLATQIAIWKHYNNYMPAVYKNHPGNSAVKKAKSLASTAKSHNSDNYKNPSVKLSINSTKMSEVENGKYFKSGAITIKLGNVSSGSISVTSPATIVNGSNKKVSTVKNGTKVYVRVPASKVTSSKSYTVKVSASKTVKAVERYSPKNSKYQDLAIVVKNKKSDSAKKTVTATPVSRKCQYANGKYYGINGTVVDKTTYSIQCEEHECEKVGNVYFGKEGNQVSYDTFNKECNKHICEKVGDTYFGKDGEEVDEEEYNLECSEHKCEVIEDKYFGKNGFEVDETTYDIECNEHKCQKVGDVYFGKDGIQVDQDTYDLECNEHICEIIGDKYFGKNGTEVDEVTYNAECVHKCQIIGDKYYGETGEEVTSEQYKEQCTHSCEI
ncbi:MAG: thioester domain-containing protein, partial [Bacilli bacterium]|nr:thioester domain-containing protein [Bacilli bacterium]